MDFVAPGGQQTHVQSFFSRQANEVVHIAKVKFVWPGGIIPNEREMPIRIGCMQAIHLAQDHSLNNVKSLPSARFKIFLRFSLLQPMEEFPGGIREPKERLSTLSCEEAAVWAKANGFKGHVSLL